MNFENWPLWANSLIVLVTIIIIAKGANWVVESAARIANHLGISELIIGLTVVAMGTSAPEFAVTTLAALQGKGDISVGNIVGSNIFNLGFILGGCALVSAIPTDPTLLRRDGTVLGVSTVLLFLLLGLDLELDRWEGFLLFGLLLVYLAYLYRSRKELPVGQEEVQQLLAGAGKISVLRESFILLIGLIAIVAGSHILVESASAIARDFGVSDWVIGVTVVAAGTSAPEFATSLAGVLKGRYAISAGNVIGSDIFNLLGVLGVAGIIQPLSIDPMGRYSLAALVGMVFLVLFFMRTHWRFTRFEGFVLVVIALARWFFDFASRTQ